MLSFVRCLYLLPDVRWSFLCEYVIICPLFISPSRCEMVFFLCEYVIICPLFISLCRGQMVFFMWVCYQLSVVDISLQMWDCPFYISMFVSVCCLFLLAHVWWSFFMYVCYLMSVIYFSFLACDGPIYASILSS